MSTGGSFPGGGVKWQRREADHSPQTSDEALLIRLHGVVHTFTSVAMTCSTYALNNCSQTSENMFTLDCGTSHLASVNKHKLYQIF
jgi:hypothetical protein